MFKFSNRLMNSRLVNSRLVKSRTIKPFITNVRNLHINHSLKFHINHSYSYNNQIRNFQTTSKLQNENSNSEYNEILNSERDIDYVDVCIVGGGVAGLSTAIKLKQLDLSQGSGNLRIILLEKSGDFGNHIVSGAVIEPKAINELFPDDINDEGISLPKDLITKVTSDSMKFLTSQSAYSLPEPPQLLNKDKNFIVSLSSVTQYLAEKAEELGIELYPGISVNEIIYNDANEVIGVATKDMGINKQGLPKDSFERGMEFHSRFTILSEGCHGSLSKKIIKKFDLRSDSNNQTYGLGIKEIWEVLPENFDSGAVIHSMGYPLINDSNSYGGGFMYHMGDNKVSVGLVIGLDYKNPYISPYQEFQKMKNHPLYKNILQGGKCLSYGARTLNEGGLQLIPKLLFPGGLIIGASAGFMNVPKIKGSHTAMKSGMIAAESVFEILKNYKTVEESMEEDTEGEVEGEIFSPIDLTQYQKNIENSWIYDELHEIRNVRPSFNSKFGILGGLIHSGLTTLITKGKEPWTLTYNHNDYETTLPARNFKPIDYPKPDGEITFDLLTSVSRTGTYHDDDEQCHLVIPGRDHRKHTERSYPDFQGIEQRFCPAGVYEYIENKEEPTGMEFKINSQNCIHCKTCDIKVPTQDINWEVPEGGDGPKYYLT